MTKLSVEERLMKVMPSYIYASSLQNDISFYTTQILIYFSRFAFFGKQERFIHHLMNIWLNKYMQA
jgi:hypothetical protein